jgi:hypothetical protein
LCDLDALGRAVDVGYVRQHGVQRLSSIDRGRLVAVRPAQLRIALPQRLEQLVGRRLEVVRFVARDPDFDAVREDRRVVQRAVRGVRRERDAVVARQLAPVRRDAEAKKGASLCDVNRVSGGRTIDGSGLRSGTFAGADVVRPARRFFVASSVDGAGGIRARYARTFWNSPESHGARPLPRNCPS